MNKLFIFLFAVSLYAGTAYIDPTLSVTSHAYNHLTREATGGTDTAFTSLQKSIDTMPAASTHVLRGGTHVSKYTWINPTKNGSSWTAGNFNCIKSYPGEWAVIDGQNQVNDWKYSPGGKAAVIGNYCIGYQTSCWLRFWKFERLEITNGRTANPTFDTVNKDYAAGFFGNKGPFWFTHCYIHDNLAVTEHSNPGGLTGYAWDNCIIEYCSFKNNGHPGNTLNDAHICMITDYNWNGIAANGCVLDGKQMMRNECRYNLFLGGSGVGWKDKGDQLLSGRNYLGGHGYNDTYKTYGNKIHHNIFKNLSLVGVYERTDFSQIYNNIFDSCPDGVRCSYSDEIQKYRITVYNNTIINSPLHGIQFYNSNTYVGHEPDYYGYAFNNIIDGSQDNWDGADIGGTRNATDLTATFYNLKIDRNYFYNHKANSGNGDPSGIYPIFVGNASSGPNPRYTVNSYTSIIDTSSYNFINNNFQNNLYQGISDTLKYKTIGSLIIGKIGDTNISIANNGKKFWAHPFFEGDTIPSYIGATDPASNGWVDDVLALANLNNATLTAHFLPLTKIASGWKIVRYDTVKTVDKIQQVSIKRDSVIISSRSDTSRTVTVSGNGSPSPNGVYDSVGLLNSRTVYRRGTDNFWIAYNGGGYWEIVPNLNFSAGDYYYGSSAVHVPIGSGWVGESGMSGSATTAQTIITLYDTTANLVAIHGLRDSLQDVRFTDTLNNLLPYYLIPAPRPTYDTVYALTQLYYTPAVNSRFKMWYKNATVFDAQSRYGVGYGGIDGHKSPWQSYSFTGYNSLPLINRGTYVDTAAGWAEACVDDSLKVWFTFASFEHPDEANPGRCSIVFMGTKDFVSFTDSVTLYTSTAYGISVCMPTFYKQNGNRYILFICQQGTGSKVWTKRFNISTKVIDDSVTICSGGAQLGTKAAWLHNGNFIVPLYGTDGVKKSFDLICRSVDTCATWTVDTMVQDSINSAHFGYGVDLMEPSFAEIADTATHSVYSGRVICTFRSAIASPMSFRSSYSTDWGHTWTIPANDTTVHIDNGGIAQWSSSPIIYGGRSIDGKTMYWGAGNGTADLIYSTDEAATFRVINTHNKLGSQGPYPPYHSFYDLGEGFLRVLGCANNTGITRINYGTFTFPCKMYGALYGSSNGTSMTLTDSAAGGDQWVTQDTLINFSSTPISISFFYKTNGTSKTFIGLADSVNLSPCFFQTWGNGAFIGTYLLTRAFIGYLFMEHGRSMDCAAYMCNHLNSDPVDTINKTYQTGWHQYNISCYSDSVIFSIDGAQVWKKTDSIPHGTMQFLISKWGGPPTGDSLEYLFVGPVKNASIGPEQNIPSAGGGGIAFGGAAIFTMGVGAWFLFGRRKKS